MQIALGLSQDRSDPARPYRDIRLTLGVAQREGFQGALGFATGSPDVVLAVARREIDLAAMNPSAFLTMAFRGTGPFSEPLPLRAIAVMPSWDRMAFAVSERTGIASLSQISDRRYPLRLSLRRSQAHATRFLIDQVLEAEGFSLGNLESWGCGFHYVDTPSEASRLEGIRNGTIEAVFDEGIKGWGPVALAHGLRFLALSDRAGQRLEALGWPVAPISPAHFPGLGEPVPAASFSGWPLFTYAGLPDQIAYQMVRALDAARPFISWDSDVPVELCDLGRDSDATVLDIPLHPGAERYYREHGCPGAERFG